MMAAWYHPSLSTCAMSFPKRFIAKCFPVFLVLTCCKHQFIRNCHQHFSSPWQQCLSKRPALSISLTRYSLGFLKGFFYMIWDMNHTGMCGYTIMSPTSGTSHQWEEAQSQLANLETGGNKSSLSNLSFQESTAVKWHLQHLSTWKLLSQFSK